jgi:hypothetical protein
MNSGHYLWPETLGLQGVARIFALRYEGLEQQLKFGNDLVLRYYAVTNVATKSKASYGLMMRGLFLVCFVTRPARVVLTR